MMRAQGTELDRSTLSLWIGRTAWRLKPLYTLLLASILARPKIFCDETPMPVFARGGTRRCQFWAVAVDDRPWSGPAPPAVDYAFAAGRKTEHAMTLLDGFSGIPQVDGYAAYKKLAETERKGKPIVLAFCLAHARRTFFEFHKATNSPIAFEALRQIAAVYAIETRNPGPERRRTAGRASGRKQTAHGSVQDLGGGAAEGGLRQIAPRRRDPLHAEPLAGAHRVPRRWPRGRTPFAGSENGPGSSAVLASLIDTALLNGVDPQPRLTDVLERTVSGQTKSHQLAELLPWNWKTARAAPAQDLQMAA